MPIQPFDVPTIPLEDPVLVFTLALGIFLISPLVIERFGFPGIVGIVVAGAILGPGGLGFVEHVGAIVLLGEVGLIYLLFTVGLDLDLRRFLQAPEDAALFGGMSFAIPFIIGSVGGVVLLDLELLAALLLASVFASHTLLAYPIVNRYGIGKNDAVTAVFGGILFTDTTALVVLALVLGAHAGEFGVALVGEIAISLGILFGMVWIVVPRIGRFFFRTFSEESYYEYLFVLSAFFLAASLAELLDLAGILGAFIAGLALNRLIPDGGTLQNRIEFTGNAFFVPFFLLHVGMFVDFSVILDGFRTIGVAAFMVGVMIGTKAAAAWIVASLLEYSKSERQVIFGLSTGQAAAALAITLLGFEAGLFDTAILNAVVLLLLVTAIVSPWITERGASAVVSEKEVTAVEEPAIDPRILLPLSHSAELQRRLLELAFLLKGDPADEPVHVLTVVQPQGRGATEERVASVRDDLEGLEDVASAAEVPIQIESRVHHNVSSGISQAAVEEGANLVIMGWDASRPLRHRMFGSIIDNVIQRLKVPIMIARLGHPINTTEELYLLLPKGIIHHAGFYESLYLVKHLADRLGSAVTVYVVDSTHEPSERAYGFVEPEIEASFEATKTWNQTIQTLRETVDEDDLVVTIAAERGGVGWHEELEDLPSRLADLQPESFIMLYPREGEPGYDKQFLRIR